MNLPDDLLDLLRGTATCFIATTMPDGAPQLTQTWVDTDGSNVVINTVEGYQKVRNISRDPRVVVSIFDAANATRYYTVRGTVSSSTTEGGAEHIEALAQRYTGGPYPWWGGRDQVRVILTISPDRVRLMG